MWCFCFWQWQFSFSRPIDLSNLFRIALLTARKSTSPAVLVTKSVSLLLSAGRLIAPTASISANPANRLVRSVVEFWESSPLANTHDGALIRARVSSKQGSLRVEFLTSVKDTVPW
jgi:hypothetical protein